MKPVQHRTNNDVLAAPPGVPIESCTPLYITRVVFPDGDNARHGVVSFWQPSEAERMRLAAGEPVRFLVWGRTHPPISVEVDGDGWP